MTFWWTLAEDITAKPIAPTRQPKGKRVSETRLATAAATGPIARGSFPSEPLNLVDGR